MFKFFVKRPSLSCPKTKKTLSIFDYNRLSRRQSYASKIVSKNYLEEIWDAIFTISNIIRGATGASLHFQTQKTEKMALCYINLMYQVLTFYSEKSLKVNSATK